MKLLKKQLLAILLGIGLIITLLPASAMAYVGAMWDTGRAPKSFTRTAAGSSWRTTISIFLSLTRRRTALSSRRRTTRPRTQQHQS